MKSDDFNVSSTFNAALMSAQTDTYTDIQNVAQLKGNKNSAVVNRELAKQFEAILMQMVLKSMHDATQSLSADGESQSMGMYTDLFDKQLSFTLSNPDQGIGKEIQSYLGKINPPSSQEMSVSSTPQTQAVSVGQTHSSLSHVFQSPKHFIESLWDSAKHAAQMIGCSPEILLAQAALETGWGSKVLPGHHQASSFNLFNIKADENWQKDKTTINALEELSGVIKKEKSHFKNYHSYLESFVDYVKMLKNDKRYQSALQFATHPRAFVGAIRDAGFATDHHYVDKVMAVYHSPLFNRLINKLKRL